MKISPVSCCIAGNLHTFKGSTDFKDTNNNSFQVKSVVNPLYYKALHAIGVNQPVYISGKLSSNEDFYIKVEPEIVKKFLTDEEGQINQDYLNKFLEIYQNIANDINQKQHEKMDIYNKRKVQNIPEVLLDFDDADKINSSFDNYMIASYNERIANVPFDAYRKTIRYFEISQTKDGFDFSDYDLKMQLIDDIEVNTQSIFIPHNEDEIFNQILKYARNEQGKLDFDLIYEAFDVILSQDLAMSPKKVIDMLKFFCSFDYSAKPEILEAVKTLNSGYFNIETETSYFYELMKLCFDKSAKFDIQKAGLLKECCDYIEEYMSRALDDIDWYPQDFDENEEDENLEQKETYEGIIKTGANIIKAYFDKITNEQGKISNNKLSLGDFIKTLV